MGLILLPKRASGKVLIFENLSLRRNVIRFEDCHFLKTDRVWVREREREREREVERE